MNTPAGRTDSATGTVTKIHSLQAIRALAAWLVVADHALLDLGRNNLLDPRTQFAWLMGETGVYAFFTISGFIMVHISWNDFSKPGAALRFIRRRLLRIVPLYWVASIAALAFHRAAATHGMDAGWHQLVQSLLFIPYRDPAGEWVPVLAQGWTLNYEMMFYIMFAATLCLRRNQALPILLLTLCALTVSRPMLPSAPLAHLASPIVLWFALGIILGTAWHVLGLSEPGWLARRARYLEPLGDASYATYLAHGLALTLLLRGWVALLGPASPWFVAPALVVATLTGYAVHFLAEQPLLRWCSSLTDLAGSPVWLRATRSHAIK